MSAQAVSDHQSVDALGVEFERLNAEICIGRLRLTSARSSWVNTFLMIHVIWTITCGRDWLRARLLWLVRRLQRIQKQQCR